MPTRQFTGNPSQIMVEQLAASGIRYVFNNSGSREAHFFDALHSRDDIHGILALHEGSVAAMAGGYTQVGLDPTAMVVHLGAGLAQCMGQLINVWQGNLPVVVITFAGDTGSFADSIILDLDHSFGPTSISAPFTKANWTVIEPEGLPQAIDRAIRVAMTPPVGPVHLAVYDRLLGTQQVDTRIIDGGVQDVRAGYPSEDDLEQVARALHEAERPMIYVGDGVWKSGAQEKVANLAERFGAAVVSSFGDLRAVSIKHRLHCGRIDQAVPSLNPDLVLCIGARHGGAGAASDFDVFASAGKVIAMGVDVGNLQNMPGLDLAILADEYRTLEQLEELLLSESTPQRYDDRREWALGQAAGLRERRRREAASVTAGASQVHPSSALNALDSELERRGGGVITVEQFAMPLDTLGGEDSPGNNEYIRAAGGSEGYGVGAAVGAKLAAPDRPVVGLVGDGSLYYADSGMWTAAHHNIPLLYVIPNNQAYGIVANSFERAGTSMKDSGDYAGVVLSGIDPVKLAEGFGVEAMHLQDEDKTTDTIAHALDVVERESRPFLLNVHLPMGIPSGGRPARQFRMT
jgi:thiamine pyrophosphate-dependent acetolactate synthase large subunit-like protein